MSTTVTILLSIGHIQSWFMHRVSTRNIERLIEDVDHLMTEIASLRKKS